MDNRIIGIGYLEIRAFPCDEAIVLIGTCSDSNFLSVAENLND